MNIKFIKSGLANSVRVIALCLSVILVQGALPTEYATAAVKKCQIEKDKYRIAGKTLQTNTRTLEKLENRKLFAENRKESALATMDFKIADWVEYLNELKDRRTTDWVQVLLGQLPQSHIFRLERLINRAEAKVNALRKQRAALTTRYDSYLARVSKLIDETKVKITSAEADFGIKQTAYEACLATAT